MNLIVYIYMCIYSLIWAEAIYLIYFILSFEFHNLLIQRHCRIYHVGCCLSGCLSRERQDSAGCMYIANIYLGIYRSKERLPQSELK